MNLKTKNIKGHLHVVFTKAAIDEINKESIKRLDEIIATLNTIDCGGRGNADIVGEIEKLKQSIDDYKQVQYESEIKTNIEMKKTDIDLIWKVLIVSGFIISIISVIYTIIGAL